MVFVRDTEPPLGDEESQGQLPFGPSALGLWEQAGPWGETMSPNQIDGGVEIVQVRLFMRVWLHMRPRLYFREAAVATS